MSPVKAPLPVQMVTSDVTPSSLETVPPRHLSTAPRKFLVPRQPSPVKSVSSAGDGAAMWKAAQASGA